MGKSRSERALCRHCRKVRSNRPRGLCYSCYYRAGVRELYPVTSKFARRGVRDYCGVSVGCEPTGHLPGTPGKVRVLRNRARLGLQLWHPRDGKIED